MANKKQQRSTPAWIFGTDFASGCLRPPVLDQSSVQCGVFVKLGLGWFGGVITRRVHQKWRHDHDYRVILQADRSTRSMKLPLESYNTNEGNGVGAWVLLDIEPREEVRRSGRAVTPNVGNTEFQLIYNRAELFRDPL